MTGVLNIKGNINQSKVLLTGWISHMVGLLRKGSARSPQNRVLVPIKHAQLENRNLPLIFLFTSSASKHLKKRGKITLKKILHNYSKECIGPQVLVLFISIYLIID